MQLTNLDILNDLKKNIINWYPMKENVTVLQIGEDKEIYDAILEKTKNISVISEKGLYKASQKYNFVVLIGVFERLKTEKEIKHLLEFAKNSITVDGKILLAMQNKFGMKYWAGEKSNSSTMKYETIISSKENVLSYTKIKQILEELDMKFKFYYPLPDYKTTNVIFTDEILPDDKNIDSRLLNLCENEEIFDFSEREAYKQIIKDDKKLFSFFSNAFFIEIAKENNFEDIKYVSFSNTRKKEYQIQTVIKSDYVFKTASNKNSLNHIKSISENINILKRCNLNLIDEFKNETIVSKYLKDAELLDTVLNRIYYEKGKEEFIKKIKEFYETIIMKLLIDKSTSEKTVFEQYNIDIPNDIKSKLHFTKNGLYDLITQNCLVQNDNIFIFDQEWKKENIPIEFILYRAIYYFSNINDKDELYSDLGISEYISYFNELEIKIQDEILDKQVWKMHQNAVIYTGKNIDIINEYHRIIENYKLEIIKKDNKIKKDELQLKDFEQGIFGLRKGIEDLNHLIKVKDEQLVHYADDLRTITNSTSWKVIKFLKYLYWSLNPFNGVKFIDRIMPPGGKRRIEYDKKKNEKEYEKRVQNYIKMADEETVEYWKGIDHRKYLKYQKILEKQFTNELSDYEKWLLSNLTTEEELRKQRRKKFFKMPKISILVPLYNTDLVFFKELLHSVHCQTYTNWELCLADGSPKPLKEIEKMCIKDKRIKYHFIGENKGISGNTNEALKLATGDYISLLDHDDLLTEDCLYEVVKTINKNPNVEFIYTDEDKIKLIDEPEFDPHFKPDFAPDTLRSGNYICHFSVFKKSLMNKLEGERDLYNGAQDFDLILRMSEITKNIIHIPKILYHWRISATSTAGCSDAKPYAYIAGVRAIEDHINRLGLKGKVSYGEGAGTYRVQYDVIGNPKVTILIPNKDGINMLKKCIDSVLEKTTYNNYEIVIIENNSENEETFKYYKEIEKNEKIKVIYYPEKGFNYSRIINYGVKNTHGDFIVQLNNDTELLTSDWLEQMLGFCQREDVGAVGVKLYYPDNTIQHAGIIIGALSLAAHVFRNLPKERLGYFLRDRLIQDLNAVTAACMMTKRKTFEDVGFMNEDFAVAFNDVDFCLKIRKNGKLIVYNPYVELIHYESKTRGEDDSPEKAQRFQNEVKLFWSIWDKKLKQGDEYYNKNLSLDSDQFEIRTEKVITD